MIELIVVIVLISMLFTFALPRLDGYLFSSDTKKVSRWIVFMVAGLKTKALNEQVRYVLHADSRANQFWISNENMDEAALEKAVENGFRLPHMLKIKGVISSRETREAEDADFINFYKKGYSDKAVIHIEDEEGNPLFFVVEPFLPGVEIIDDYEEG